MPTTFLLVVASLTWHHAAPGQVAAPQALKEASDEKTIRALITQLSDDSFDKREDASKGLAAIGEPALQLLKNAAKESTDAEVRERAGQLAANIENGLFPFAWTVKGHRNIVSSIAPCPNGKQFVSGGGDGIFLWDAANGKMISKLGGGARSLAVFPDGTKLLAGSDNKNAYVIDVATGKDVFVLSGHTGAVFGVAVLPDGKRGLTGSKDRSVRLWDLTTGKHLANFADLSESVYCVALTPDGKTAAVAHYTPFPNPKGTFGLWDVESQKRIREFPRFSREVTGLSFSTDGKRLLSCCFDKTVRIWDVASGQELKRFECDSLMEHGYFVDDNKRIVCCGKDSELTVQLWDIEKGKRIMRSPSAVGGYRDLAVLSEGRLAAAGVDGTLRLWQWRKDPPKKAAP
jgi:WD40 repeat protein